MSDSATLTRKDFITDQDVRWCPGCGDYAILSTVMKTLPDYGIAKEDIVFVSGIGCSSRFPHYVDTYGFNTIHGRAPTVATGLKISKPDLSVWVITGDGDGMSIGGNHLLHLLRRNLDLQIILFNNEIYGLTKGQYSPTSQTGLKTKSSPLGTIEHPVQPCSFALGADASFVARVADVQIKEMEAVVRRSQEHQGTAFIEVLQNCVIYNDNTHGELTGKDVRAERQVWLEHGQPLIFGAERDKGIRQKGFGLEVVPLGDGIDESDLIVHDERNPDPAYAVALASMHHQPGFPAAMGVLRAIERPCYETALHEQIAAAQAARPDQSLDDLYRGFGKVSTWTVD